jgi:hypothetical protein
LREISWRRWFAVGLLAAVGAAIGVASGIRRHPVYSSTAIVSSARVNVLAEALPGYVSAATALASTYSRIATSDVVKSAVARQLKISVNDVDARLSATPVPDDPVIMIVGTGPSAGAARRLASTGATSLVAYVAHMVGSPAAAQSTLAKYTSANDQLLKLNAQVGRLRANQVPGSSPGPSLKAALAQQAQVSLRTRSLASTYINQNLATASGAAPQILTASSPAGNDRRSRIEDFGLIGLAVGLILGLLIERVTSRPRSRATIQIRKVGRV